MFLTPYYTIENKQGYSGKTLWSFHKFGLSITSTEPQRVPFHSEPIIKNFNPYRDLQHGCLTIGYKERNYHIKLFNYFSNKNKQ